MRWLSLVCISLLFAACEEVHKVNASGVTTQSATAAAVISPTLQLDFCQNHRSSHTQNIQTSTLSGKSKCPAIRAAGDFHVFHEGAAC